MKINKLDNPTWHSLSETHKDFAVEYEDIKFYHIYMLIIKNSLKKMSIVALRLVTIVSAMLIAFILASI